MREVWGNCSRNHKLYKIIFGPEWHSQRNLPTWGSWPDSSWLWAISKEVSCSFNKHYSLSGPVLGLSGNEKNTPPLGPFIPPIGMDRHPPYLSIMLSLRRWQHRGKKANLSRVRGARSSSLGDWEIEWLLEVPPWGDICAGHWGPNGREHFTPL